MAEDTLKKEAEQSRRLPEERDFVLGKVGPLAANLMENEEASPGGAMLAFLTMAADCAYHDEHAGGTDEEHFVELAKVAYRAAVLSHKDGECRGCS